MSYKVKLLIWDKIKAKNAAQPKLHGAFGSQLQADKT